MNVILLAAHTHAEKLYAANENLDVDESTAAWLIENGVAKADNSTKPSPQSSKGGN